MASFMKDGMSQEQGQFPIFVNFKFIDKLKFKQKLDSKSITIYPLLSDF
jgi:hypothetical protein